MISPTAPTDPIRRSAVPRLPAALDGLFPALLSGTSLPAGKDVPVNEPLPTEQDDGTDAAASLGAPFVVPPPIVPPATFATANPAPLDIGAEPAARSASASPDGSPVPTSADAPGEDTVRDAAVPSGSLANAAVRPARTLPGVTAMADPAPALPSVGPPVPPPVRPPLLPLAAPDAAKVLRAAEALATAPAVAPVLAHSADRPPSGRRPRATDAIDTPPVPLAQPAATDLVVDPRLPVGGERPGAVTPAAVAPTQASRPADPAAMAALIEHVEFGGDGGTIADRASLTLVHHSVGRLDVALSAEADRVGSQVGVRLGSDDPAVRQTLTDAVPALVRAADERRLELGEIVIGPSEATVQRDARDPPAGRGGAPGGDVPSQRRATPPGAPASSTLPTGRRAGGLFA